MCQLHKKFSLVKFTLNGGNISNLLLNVSHLSVAKCGCGATGSSGVMDNECIWWLGWQCGGASGTSSAKINSLVRTCQTFTFSRNIYPQAARERMLAQGPVWALATAKRARTAMKHFIITYWFNEANQELAFKISNVILIGVEVHTDYGFFVVPSAVEIT